MSDITQVLSTYTWDAPQRYGDSDQFNINMDKTLAFIPTMLSQLSIFGQQANALKYAVNLLLAEVQSLRDEVQNVKDDAVNDTTDVLTDCQGARDAAIAVSGATAYDPSHTYVVGESCIGSDGNTYRRINVSGNGDNPVGSATGNWRQITMLTDFTRVLALETEIAESITIKDNSVAIGVNGMKLAENARITIGKGSRLRLI